ncbi:hypothetical protein JCGZ_05253 [Jatropha curcas]|uniref:Uncharacterized protein n=1 Tax=Jatropha curcas TaxID=180498 RepID=A0A067JK33_JATCU|nr:cation/H(+) antiporter 15 [Jatropha curcas]KDP20370.1 hypothetical protein JCGZ_05253 [Jatropha curcas]
MNNNQTKGLSDGEYIVLRGAGNTITACYYEKVTNDKAFWKSEYSLINSLPYFVIQLSLMMLCIRLLFIVLKPLRQPRFLAELLSGVLLGQTFTAVSPFSNRYIHPAKSTTTLDTMGQLGLVYYMFLVGLEIDITTLRCIERKAMCNAAITILFPLFSGIGLYYFIMHFKDAKLMGMGGAVWAITLTVTSFSDLARVLSDMKLLHTDIGRLALSSAILCDLVAWSLLVATITMANQHFYYLNVFTMIAFAVLCWFVVRPGISWIIRLNNSSNGGIDYELLTYFILGGVVVFGFITDACGSQSMIGAFLFGLVIPKGDLTTKLIEKLEDFVTGIMLPAFFWTNGLKTDLFDMTGSVNPLIVITVVILACLTKIVGAFIFSMTQGMSTREGILLGVLMNTKGVLALIVMNSGRDLRGFDQQLFAIMTMSLILITLMVKPIAMAAIKSTKHVRPFKRRTIERSKNDSELRILSCIHSTSNLSGMINLLQYSNPTKQSPICIFALHLLQLTERRVTAMLIVHDAYNHVTAATGQGSKNQEVQESEHIINAFHTFESKFTAISIQALTVVSPYSSMHEDVSRLAEDKRVNLILVPFHKQPDIYGKLQDEEDVSLRAVNRNLLATAPCSIGILIDRGLGEFQTQTHFIMAFLGGADSREALAFAWRMAGTMGVMLTVARFVPTTAVVNEEKEALTELDIEKKLDDDYVNDFRYKTMYDDSIIYTEVPVSSADEIITTMRRMHNGCELYIVGRGQGAATQLTMGLLEWSDCEELGALGDTLLSSDFSENSSILVIQQHCIPATREGGVKNAHVHHKFHHYNN